MFRNVATGVAKNFSIMLIQQLATWVSTFLLMIILPRHLGPVLYGELFLAISIVEMFRVGVAFGSSHYLAKAASREPGRTGELIVDGTVLRLGLAAVSTLLLVLLSWALGYESRQALLILIIGLGLFWHAGTVTLSGCFQGHELIKYISVGYVLERVFASVVTIVALLMGAGVVAVAVIFFLSTAVSFFGMAVHLRKIAPQLPWSGFDSVVRHAREGIPYFLFTAFGVIYYRIGAVVLSYAAPGEAVGWYGGASRLFDTVMFFPALLSVVVYPVLSRYWQEDPDVHSRATTKGLELVILVGILIASMFGLFARPLVSLLYGLEGYEPTVIILQVLSVGLVLVYVDIILGTLLLSADKQKAQALLALAGIPVSLGLNATAIPLSLKMFGNAGIGPAVATVLTEVFVMTVMLRLAPRGVLRSFRFSLVVRSLLIAAAASGLVVGAEALGVPVLVRVLLFPALYLGGLYGSGAMSDDDREIGREIARRVKGRVLAIIGHGN